MEKKSMTAIEISEDLSKSPNEETRTKKDLEKRWNFSDVTITKSIDASTLSTSERSYTVLELKEWFVPARQLIDEGKTYEEVKQILSGKRGTAEASSETESFEMLDSLLFEGMTTMIEGRLEQYILQMPQVAKLAILRLLNNPKIRAEILRRFAITVKATPITLEARSIKNLLPESKEEQ